MSQREGGAAGRWGRWREELRRRERELSAREGLSVGWLVAAFALAMLLVFVRSPSLFTNPQFWAEDGGVWFSQAYNGGWLHSLTIPLGGYLNTLQRLATGPALLVPFRWAPLPMALVGLVCEALPVPILLSARCRNWAPLSLRLLFTAAYIAIPNAREVHVVCTNAHWHLALAEVLLGLSAAPRSRFGRVFDVAMFLLGGVCGPFAVMLLPLLGIFWWVRRQRWTLVAMGLLSCGVVVQLYFLRTFHETRFVRPLGASVAMVVRMVGGDVFLGLLRGSTPYGLHQPFFICLGAFVIGLGICAYCWRYVRVEVRLFFVYCCAVLVAALKSPLVPPTTLPLWQALLKVASLRYWFYPSLPFLFSILWCIAYARNRVVRWTAVALGLLLCQGIYRDWRIPALDDLHFAQEAAKFEAAPPGSHVLIPLNPPGWVMDLKKK